MASQNGQGNFLIGWGLLFVPLLEIAGIFSKIPVSNYFRSQYPVTIKHQNLLLLILLLIMVSHFFMGYTYIIVCIQIIQGVALINGSPFYGILAVFLFFIVIAKEAFIIMMILGATSLPGTNKLVEKRVFGILSKQSIVRLSWDDFIQDMTGDGYLFLFTAISFTLLWHFVLSLSPTDINQSEMIHEVLVRLELFLMIYLPLRSSNFPFELNNLRKKKQWIFYCLSIAAAAILSLFPLVI